MSQSGQEEPLLNSKDCSISTFSQSNLRFSMLDRQGRQILTRNWWSKLWRDWKKGRHKHGYLQSVRGSRMATLFQFAWISTRSSWIAVSIQDQWFDWHEQALLNKYPRFGLCSFGGLCAKFYTNPVGIFKTCVARKSKDGCWRNHTSSLWRAASGPGNDYTDHPSIPKFLIKPRRIHSLQTNEIG